MAYLKKKERFTNYYTACKHTPIWVYSGTVQNTVTENYFDRCNDEKERRKGFMLEEVNDKWEYKRTTELLGNTWTTPSLKG